MTRIAIIAGAGNAPARACEEALRLGREPLVLALEETGAAADLEEAGVRCEAVSIGQPQAILDRMAESGVREALIVGKVPKELHFGGIEFDERALTILGRLQSRADGNLFAALAEELESEGIALAGQSAYLRHFLIGAGVLCGAGIPEGREDEARAALALAREVARLDIGQTVCVKNGLPVAVEAAEHTDETIRRAGKLAGAGFWVAKAARPNQDDRFDVPSIGPGTLAAMAGAGATLLIVEANRLFLFDRDEALRLADEAEIAVVALS